MLGMLRKIFGKVTPESMMEESLADAKRFLLLAEAAREHADANVELYTARIARLQPQVDKLKRERDNAAIRASRPPPAPPRPDA